MSDSLLTAEEIIHSNQTFVPQKNGFGFGIGLGIILKPKPKTQKFLYPNPKPKKNFIPKPKRDKCFPTCFFSQRHIQKTR